MRILGLLCFSLHFCGDGYISAASGANENLNSKLQQYNEVGHKQRIRHKSLAAFTASIDNRSITDHNQFENNDENKELVLAAQALPLRANRTKSTLDKLVREPVLGMYISSSIKSFHGFHIQKFFH